jgi:K+/H+ antiporter YhaU regulatory subunit KhtT
MTFAFSKVMSLEVRTTIKHMASSLGTCTSRVKMDFELIVLRLNKKDLIAVEIPIETSYVFFGKVLSDTQPLRATGASKVLQILRPSPREPETRVLTPLTMLFCKTLTNSLLAHFVRL